MGGRGATPTRVLIFNSYDMKNLWFKFGYDIFAGFKLARLKLRGLQLHFIKQLKNGHPNLSQTCHFAKLHIMKGWISVHFRKLGRHLKTEVQ